MVLFFEGGPRGLKFNVSVVHCMYGNAHFLVKTSCRSMELCRSDGTNLILIFLKQCCELKRNNHKPMLQGVYSHQCNKYNFGKICWGETYSKARHLIFACGLYYTPTNEPSVGANSSLLLKHFMDARGFHFLCTLI